MTPIKIIRVLFTSIVLLSVGLILLSGISSVPDPHSTFGIQTASASTHLGIVGRQAPELELSNWIDGNGKPMDPVKLKDNRGKVIFLYFFQDW